VVNHRRKQLIIHKISVKIIEITMQLVIGTKIRQFLDPNSKSPGSLNIPNRPNNITARATATITSPKKTSHLPICPGPNSPIIPPQPSADIAHLQIHSISLQ